MFRMSQPNTTDSDEGPAEMPSRNRPLSTRAADDALPQTPKYKTLDKMYSSVQLLDLNFH